MIPIVLNELSLHPIAPNETIARIRMKEIVIALRILAETGVRYPLLRTFDIGSAELSPGYPIAKWWNDPTVRREERLYWQSRIDKTIRVPATENQTDDEQWECHIAGDKADGFGLVKALSGLGLSFQSAARWDAAWVDCTITRLDQDANIVVEESSLRNVSRVEHIVEHSP